MVSPIYTAVNCRFAYQLNWSLSVFARTALPSADEWLPELKLAVEPDGVRILSFQHRTENVLQFWLSVQPTVSPSAAIQKVKGRLQYLVRDQIPLLWRRNYRIESVGDATNRILQSYVKRQPNRHRLADPRSQSMMENSQFIDETIDLETIRYSSHGQFVSNLHFVLESAEHLPDIRKDAISTTREMIIRACRQKHWLLSRIGVASNHLHLLIGSDVSEVPQEIGLSLMNNIAYAHGMKAMFTYSFYVGTFGNYDRDAIRGVLSQDDS